MNKKKLLKYLPTHVSKYVYIGIGVLFIALLLRTKRNQDGGIKIGDTTLITKNYDRILDLPEEEKMIYEEQIQKYDALINGTYTGTDEQIELGADPQQIRFLQKAFNLSALGRHTEGLKVLNEAKKYYPDSFLIQEFEARTYILAEAYKSAANTYAQLIKNNPERYMEYIKPQIFSYIELQDDDTAGKLYIEYISKGGTADSDIINGIRALRGLDPQ